MAGGKEEGPKIRGWEPLEARSHMCNQGLVAKPLVGFLRLKISALVSPAQVKVELTQLPPGEPQNATPRS